MSEYFKDYITINKDESAKSNSFFDLSKVKKLNKDIFEELKRVAFETKQNVRINLHDSPESLLHNMIIFQWRDTFIKPHKHLYKEEVCHMIEGEQTFYLFDDDMNVELSLDANVEDSIIIKIPKDCYHSAIIKSEYVIFHEIKVGPFLNENDSVFAKNVPSNFKELNLLINL